MLVFSGLNESHIEVVGLLTDKKVQALAWDSLPRNYGMRALRLTIRPMVGLAVQVFLHEDKFKRTLFYSAVHASNGQSYPARRTSPRRFFMPRESETDRCSVRILDPLAGKSLYPSPMRLIVKP